MSNDFMLAHEQTWLRGQDVHVRIRGLEGETDSNYKREVVEGYVMSRLNPLDLDLNIIWDDDLTEGGISFNFGRGYPGSPFNMRKSWSFKKEPIEYPPGSGNYLTDKILIINVQIDLDVMDQYPVDAKNRYHAFRNVVLHEFLHCLGLAHINNLEIHKRKPMDKSIMNPHVSTADLYWAKSEQLSLKRLYGAIGKKHTFKKEDIGKTVGFLHWRNNSKSFAFRIDKEVMYIPGVKFGYKKVIY